MGVPMSSRKSPGDLRLSPSPPSSSSPPAPHGTLLAPELADELEAILARSHPHGITDEQKAYIDRYYPRFAACRKVHLLAERLGITVVQIRNYWGSRKR